MRRFSRQIPRVLPALVLALLAGGCAGTGLRPGSAGEPDEIQELKTRVIELQRKAAVQEVELARLRQQVAELLAAQGGRSSPRPAPPSRRNGGEPAPAAEAVPEPGGPPAARPSSPRPSSPAFEEVDIVVPPSPVPRPPAAAAAPQRHPASEINPPVLPPSASMAPPARPPSPAEPESAGTISPAAQALYDRGYTLYNQGHYVDAEASFQRFLQSEPKSDLADNAEYWIGECRYSRHDLRGALAAFRETVARYPQGNKVPDALLKQGQTLEAMGDVEGARTAYREVTRRFPNTAAAAAADERRAKLP